MSGEGAFYLVAVSGGTVVDKQNTLQDKNANGNKSQHWTVEYGNDPNQVAFQNANNGEWLRAFSGAAYGKIDTGEKQWWTLSDGPSPGSKWIKCNDFPDAYLCNANGSYIDNNKVYAWPKQLNWTHALTWHMKDAKGPGFTPKDWKASDTGDKSEELNKREADLAERDKKLKEIEAREAAVVDKERKAKDLDGREAALAEREKNLKDLESKEQALGAREQELTAKEAAQKKQADQLAAQDKELASKAGQSTGKPDGNSADQAALQKKIDELKVAERDLASREAAAAKKEQLAAAKDKELKAKQAELEKKLREAASNGANAEALLKAENNNLKLQLKLKDLEKELEAAKRASAVSSGANKPDDDAQLKRLKDENARLKKLVAQQVLKKPSKPSHADGTNGEHPASKPSTNTPSGGNQKVDNSKPTANSSRPVVPSHKIGDHAGSNTGPHPSESSTGPKNTGGEDPELAKLRDENARLKQQMAHARKPDGKPTGTSPGQSGSPQSSVKLNSPAAGKQAASNPGKTNTSSKQSVGVPHSTTATLTNSGAGAEDPELAKLRDENARLKQQTANAKKPTGTGKSAGSSATEGGVPDSWLRPANLTSSNQPGSKPGKSSSGSPNGTGNGNLAAGGKGDPKDFVNGIKQPPSANGSTVGKPASRPGNAGSKKPTPAGKTPGQKTPNGTTNKNPSKSGAGTPTTLTGPNGDKEPLPQKYDCGHVVYPPPRKVGMKAVGYVYE